MLQAHPSVDRVTAFDPSARMARGRARGIDTVVARADALPLADESVDAVFSGSACIGRMIFPG